jgi:hypothetical protein
MSLVELLKNRIVYLYANFFTGYKKNKTRKIGTSGTCCFNKFNVKFIVVFLLFFATMKIAFTQNLWEDKATVDSIKSGLFYTYNFEFEKAETICDAVNIKYPNHPAGLMYEAIILYWKYYPLQAGTEMGNKYESLLLKSLSASQIQLQKMPNHQLTNFFAMMPRMMLLQFYADNGEGIKSIPHLLEVYKSIIKGFGFCQSTPEYYFTTGLYDYYIEAYPEANPFYKPFVYFFPGGNKRLGLSELYKCWQQSEFIGPEALTFMAYIYINFESKSTEGLKYTAELAQKYPKNPLFAQYYVQLLLLNKQYKQAEIIVNQFKENKKNSPFFKKIFLVYDAIIIEHYHSNYAKAEESYKSTVASMNLYGNYGNRYIAYAYFGLSRIKKMNGLSDEAQVYRSKAKKIAQYPKVNFD